jgi:2-iminobutanoate/2-iminopropanoate deaminase
MSIRMIQTDAAPAAIGPYSQAIVAGPFMFVSGQIGLVPESGELTGENLEPQAKQALQNMARIVRAAGFELDQVVAVDVYLTDIQQFGPFNKIYQDFFGAHRPARAVVQVGALPKGAVVEVKCVVYSG